MKSLFKSKDYTIDYANEIVKYEPSIVDFLRNGFIPTLLGVKGTILRLIEKDLISIDKKNVNLGTPWQPNEQDIIQLSLTNKANPDNLSKSEDFMIRWLIFTYGDGVHTNITKVLDDLDDEEFVSVNNEMFELWKVNVFKYAHSLDLFSNKPLQHGINQSEIYKVLKVTEPPSMAMVYGIVDIEKEEIKSLLSIFDQSL